jgi:hypothetical protein
MRHQKILLNEAGFRTRQKAESDDRQNSYEKRITVVQVTGVQSSQSRMDGQNAQSKCSKQIA